MIALGLLCCQHFIWFIYLVLFGLFGNDREKATQLMVILPRALLVQQLFKLGASQASLFGSMKMVMPTASEALPGNNQYILCLKKCHHFNRE